MLISLRSMGDGISRLAIDSPSSKEGSKVSSIACEIRYRGLLAVRPSHGQGRHPEKLLMGEHQILRELFKLPIQKILDLKKPCFGPLLHILPGR